MEKIRLITGQDLVQRIESLANAEVRQAQREVWSEAEVEINKEFRRLGIELDAHETLKALRRFDVGVSSRPMTIQIMESILQVLDSKRSEIPGTSLPLLAEFLKDTYFDAKKRESSKRVLLTHVNAALRCFKRRYINSWQSFYGEKFDSDSFLRDVDVLLAQTIDSPESLTRWAHEVMELSNRYGVDRQSLISATRENRMISRPIGIISLGSEGPYSRQWFAWIGANLDRLLDSEFEVSSENTRPTGRTDFSWQTKSSKTTGVVAPETKSASEKVSVKVVSVANEDVQAKSEWAGIETSASAFGNWSFILKNVWRGKGELVRATLAVKGGAFDFEIDVPEGTLDQVTGTISEALDSLTKRK